MYSIHISFKMIIFILFFLGILYGSHLFVIWTNQTIINSEITPFLYSLPIIILISFMFLIFISMKISEYLYSIIYLIFGLYLGYLVYILLISIAIKILLIFYTPPLYISLLLLYLLPLIICIYGVINALVTKIIKIVLKYPGFKGKYTILHLSDIHLGAIHQKNSVIRIVKEIKQLAPDIVVITGDMADGSLRVKADWLVPFNNLNIPVLYVTGNHEELNPKKDMIDAVNTTKIKYIGEHGRFKYKGVNFIGEDFGYDLKKCLLNVKQEEGVPNVLLSHVPKLKPKELEKYNIFLFLAGHTHGGQLFPLHIITYFANACFSGLYGDKNKEHFIYVTDGVNNALAPMRVGSKRVFPIITIEG